MIALECRKRLAFLTKTVMLLAVLGGLMACALEKASPIPGNGSGEGRLRVATTTSLYDTGLWDYLEPTFEERYATELQVISSGTGKALELGRRGDVDVLLTHDKQREETFVAQGYGTDRHVVAYNYFLIVGPDSDPAGIKDMSPTDAFLDLITTGMANPNKLWFVSRGDNSGTHAREKLLWQKAGYEYEAVRNSGGWYLEAGAGMGAILTLSDEKSAYTLTDIGTYLAFKRKLGLVPLVDSGDLLLNVYSAMAINPDMHPHVNTAMAENLIQFLTSEEIQELIGKYGIEEYGIPLFTPAAGQELQ